MLKGGIFFDFFPIFINLTLFHFVDEMGRGGGEGEKERGDIPEVHFI